LKEALIFADSSFGSNPPSFPLQLKQREWLFLLSLILSPLCIASICSSTAFSVLYIISHEGWGGGGARGGFPNYTTAKIRRIHPFYCSMVHPMNFRLSDSLRCRQKITVKSSILQHELFPTVHRLYYKIKASSSNQKCLHGII
jgi:hypothetical protein